ncbi:MAG: hypothetical protein WAO98_05405 [Alphaproteobacteria bacterium]
MNPLLAESAAKMLIAREPLNWEGLSRCAHQYANQALVDISFGKALIRASADIAKKGPLSGGQISMAQKAPTNVLINEELQQYFYAVELGAHLFNIENKRQWTKTQLDCQAAFAVGSLVAGTYQYLTLADRINLASLRQGARDQLIGEPVFKTLAHLFAETNAVLNDAWESTIELYRKTITELPSADGLDQACRDLFPPVSEFLYPLIPIILGASPMPPKSGPKGPDPDSFDFRNLGPS